IVAIWALGIAGAIAVALAVGPWHVRLGLFVVTVCLEIGVLFTVLGLRRRLDPGDEARRPWTWIALGLGARVLAELRLTTLHFHCIPAPIADDPGLRDLYIFGLRYFYILGDALIAGALVILC